jgi:DNA-binding response OmpR family regulator
MKEIKILYAEDDKKLSEIVTSFLVSKGYIVEPVYDGDSVLEKVESNDGYSLYLLDINMPKINGIDLVKLIRQKDNLIPIIMLTASSEIENFIEAFDNGCSEYIKKPFHIKELDIRINKLLGIEEQIITIADGLEFDTKSFDLRYNNQDIKLRKKLKRLLALLVTNMGKTVTSEMIEEYVWEGEIKENYPIRQLLKDLRKSLPHEDMIKTEIGVGYRIG